MKAMMMITAMLYGRFDKNRAKGVADLCRFVCASYIFVGPTQVFVFSFCILHFSVKIFILSFNNTVS